MLLSRAIVYFWAGLNSVLLSLRGTASFSMFVQVLNVAVVSSMNLRKSKMEKLLEDLSKLKNFSETFIEILIGNFWLVTTTNLLLVSN